MFVKLLTHRPTPTPTPKFSLRVARGDSLRHLFEGQEGDAVGIHWMTHLFLEAATGMNSLQNKHTDTPTHTQKVGKTKVVLLYSFCYKQRGSLIFQNSLIGAFWYAALVPPSCPRVSCHTHAPRLQSPARQRLNYYDTSHNQQGCREHRGQEKLMHVLIGLSWSCTASPARQMVIYDLNRM